MLLAGLDPSALTARDWVDVARVAIVEQGERVEAVDTWLAKPLFPQKVTPETLEEWVADPAWLEEQEQILASMGGSE